MRSALASCLVLQAVVAACTARDPLYCDEHSRCAGGQRCNLPTRTCENADAGADLAEPGRCLGASAGQPCGDTTCAAGQLLELRCDDQGACRPSPKDCGGYVCASSTACRDRCGGKEDCTRGFECLDGSCTSDLPLGSSCGTNPKACASGYCVNGACCETGACPACQACDVSGKGTCSAVPDGSSCGPESCTGTTKQTQVCRAGTCTEEPSDCGLYACDGTGQGCLTACTGGSGCSGAAYCEATVCKKKKANGTSCGTAAECQSGLCTATEKVCCDTACGSECETCAGKTACSPKTAGTPCGDQKLVCDNKPQSSAITQPRCNGAKACVPTTVQSCDPYRCQLGSSGTPSCRTSCAAQADCTTLCDLFLVKGTCRPAAEVCFADVKVCPTAGAGTQASPHCKVGSCTGTASSRTYVSVADGKYLENLPLGAATRVVVARGSTGTVWTMAAQPKVRLEPQQPGTAGITVPANAKLYLSGFELAHPSPSNPPKSTDPSGELIVVNKGSIEARGSVLHHANSGACLLSISSKVKLEDVLIHNCSTTGIQAEQTELVMQEVAILFSILGVKHDTGPLTMRDVVIRLNGGGLQTFGSTLDVDRVRVIGNLADGIHFLNNTSGKVTNLAVYNNFGKGILFHNNASPPSFLNVTIAKNGGLEIEEDTQPYIYTKFTNCIIWDVVPQPPFGQIQLYNCDVNLTSMTSYCPPLCTSFNADPLFVGADPEPYMRQPTSPCVDAGNDAALGLPALDLLGKPRQVDRNAGGARVDLGAFELQP